MIHSRSMTSPSYHSIPIWQSITFHNPQKGWCPQYVILNIECCCDACYHYHLRACKYLANPRWVQPTHTIHIIGRLMNGCRSTDPRAKDTHTHTAQSHIHFPKSTLDTATQTIACSKSNTRTELGGKHMWFGQLQGRWDCSHCIKAS